MIVLDTHIWVRWINSLDESVAQSEQLPESICELIENSEKVAVSGISCWEVAYLVEHKKLLIPTPINEWVDNSLNDSGVICLPLTAAIAVRAAQLPNIHRDPADRFIISTAIEYQAKIISFDNIFAQYKQLDNLLISKGVDAQISH